MAALSIKYREVRTMDKVTIGLLAFIVAMIGALPAATVGFCFWTLQQKLLKTALPKHRQSL